MLQDEFMRKLSRLAEWEKTMILSSLQRITSILDVETMEAAPILTTGPVEAPVEKITEFFLLMTIARRTNSGWNNRPAEHLYPSEGLMRATGLG